MEDAIRFTGRILYLSQDPALITAQLEGRQLSRMQAGPLRDDVSTDEITPVTTMLSYDERLGEFPYVGLQAGSARPIGRGAVRAGGFAVTVAGRRYGKGSSREHSPLAELSAGIRLVVAESFERIYQQNCDNIGILTTTDFGVLDRIAAGEAIAFDTFLEGRDELTRRIIRAGGLMKMAPQGAAPANRPSRIRRARGQTLAEKILQRNLHPDTPDLTPGKGVFVRTDWRFSHDYFTGMSAHLMHRAHGKPAPLHDPQHIVVFHDHLVLAPQSVPHVSGKLLPAVAALVQSHDDFARDYPVLAHGSLPDGSGAEGICHALMAERYALPGQIVAGTDSHTPHSGALGCLAFGVGSTDMAHAWTTGYVRCKVPDTLRIEISGRLRPGVTAKDVVLALLRSEAVRQGQAIGAVFEYGGQAVRAMSVDERATLTNMTAELGGFTGIVEPDAVTTAFIKDRRGVDFPLEAWMKSDPDAPYRDVIRMDGAALQPMAACPGDPGNGVAVDEIAEDVAVDIAYGGSCTAGKRSDFDAYHEVLAWGLARGMKVASGTRFYLQFGTMDVRRYCEERGYLQTFERAGATLVMPGCGSCANCGPGQSTSAGQVTISAINRNFPGRSGPGQVWLASPYTVAASALAGKITPFDSRSPGHQG